MLREKIESFLFKVQGISLKWKLLIPFISLAVIGTTTLLFISFHYQKQLIEKQEIQQALDLFGILNSKITDTEYTALSLASLIANDKEIAKLVSRRAKFELYDYVYPLYQILSSEHGVYQLHFHSMGAWSLLRMNAPQLEGEKISYRASVMDVQRSGTYKTGIEWGLTGLSIRAIVPLFLEEQVVGSLEVGFPLDQRFLARLKGQWKADFAIFQILGPNKVVLISSTSDFPVPKVPDSLDELPVVKVSSAEAANHVLLIGPLKTSSDELVALVCIKVDRQPILKKLKTTRDRTLMVAGLGIFLSCLLTYLVAVAFVRPIKEVVREADEIAEGRRESLLRPRPMDEMGVLTNALNRLLSILLMRKDELERYAKILEYRVLQRTDELIKSEEKYRTLVENLPIVVYRILKDGTVEFVNSYFTEKLGYTIEEAVKDKRFWWEKICGLDIKSYQEILDCCWEKGKELRKERKIKTKDGKELIVVDHIIPVKSNGDIRWIDGFMVDITELKALEAKVKEAEELQALRDISQRFAHEIRNPITAAGGFAKRLYCSLPEDSPYKKPSKIILMEIARLESLLNILLNTIEPIEMKEEPLDIIQILEGLVLKFTQDAKLQYKEVYFKKGASSLKMRGHPQLLEEAFETILNHSLYHMPEGGCLTIEALSEDSVAQITITHPSVGISRQDAAEFFLPRVSPERCPLAYPLPRVRMIIHRHGGKVKIKLHETEQRQLEIMVELPTHKTDE